MTLTLEPFLDRNVFIFRHAATVHLFNDDRCFAMELQRLYRSLRDGTVRNHARIHPRTCTQRDTQTHARARAHTHTQVQRQSVLNSLTDALRDPTCAMCAWCVEHPHLRCTCARTRARAPPQPRRPECPVYDHVGSLLKRIGELVGRDAPDEVLREFGRFVHTHTHTHKHTNGHAHSQRMFGSSVIDLQPMVSRDGDEIAHRQPAHMDFNFAQVKKEQRKEKAKLPRRQFPSEVLF